MARRKKKQLDILDRLVQSFSLRGSPSILNPMLIADTAEKVEGMLFVDQVHSISKSKSGVEIDLAYRRPVAVVTVDANTMPGVIEKGVEIKLAVDRNGVVMPKQLSQTPHLPIISMLYPVKRQTQLNTWADWPDARVRAAAKISQYFPERRLGVQTGDEATVQQKLAAIDDLISRLGSLDRKTGRVFDVRTGQAVEVPRDKVAAMPEMNF